MFKSLAAGLFSVPTLHEKELHDNQIRHARQVGKQELTASVKAYTDEESIPEELVQVSIDCKGE